MTDWNKHYQLIRAKGDKKVQTWSHPNSGLSCDIYLRGTQFVALFLEKMFNAPDVAMLRKQLRDYAENWITMDWHPLIEVELEEPHSYRGDIDKKGLSLGIDRYYVSISPAGEVFKVGWDVDEKHRKAQMETMGGGYGRQDVYKTIKLAGIPLGAPIKQNDCHWVMDYSESLWFAFENIIRGLQELDKRLRRLVGSKAGLLELMNFQPGGRGSGTSLLLKDRK